MVSGGLASLNGTDPSTDPLCVAACRTALREVGGSEPRRRFYFGVMLSVLAQGGQEQLCGHAPTQGGGDPIYNACGQPTNESNVCNRSRDDSAVHACP